MWPKRLRGPAHRRSRTPEAERKKDHDSAGPANEVTWVGQYTSLAISRIITAFQTTYQGNALEGRYPQSAMIDKVVRPGLRTGGSVTTMVMR
ncbi:MAG: hypothetical protein Q9181_003280 [Wetmoreana brouardii]